MRITKGDNMEQMITSLGFPIACCLGLAYYVKYQNEYHVNISKNSFGDYRIKEKNNY
mgnify:CR=1 FL=1